MTPKARQFEYAHGIVPGLGQGDVLVAWAAAALLVLALTAAI